MNEQIWQKRGQEADRSHSQKHKGYAISWHFFFRYHLFCFLKWFSSSNPFPFYANFSKFTQPTKTTSHPLSMTWPCFYLYFLHLCNYNKNSTTKKSHLQFPLMWILKNPNLSSFRPTHHVSPFYKTPSLSCAE